MKAVFLPLGSLLPIPLYPEPFFSVGGPSSLYLRLAAAEVRFWATLFSRASLVSDLLCPLWPLSPPNTQISCEDGAKHLPWRRLRQLHLVVLRRHDLQADPSTMRRSCTTLKIETPLGHWRATAGRSQWLSPRWRGFWRWPTPRGLLGLAQVDPCFVPRAWHRCSSEPRLPGQQSIGS